MTKFDILQSAEELFAEFGYRKTTIEDIASRVGISRAEFYRFFPSRALIDEALAELQLCKITDELERIADSTNQSCDLRLARLLRTVAELSSEKIVKGGHANDLVRDAVTEAWPVSCQFLARVRFLLSKLLKERCTSEPGCVESCELAASCITMLLMNYLHPMLASSYKADNPGIEGVISFVFQSLNTQSEPTLKPFPA
ncbi:TetR/AcrR family transcriptional regulator [Agrobacterium tumefaciens]|uniref:TetR/AcrR family transcriptional regulator n=1 Tax=Agrobacterium tumefaciens TaxID=358 RepID=UPI001571977D|nr:helix-turn-helix domain-containing protein [Agrobacterium tumefaciens]NTA19364.1 helix-turn-helix transcriptional regulator [Agrobacterium tumefaciens]WCK74850.1 helix-turn-helix domain containing protein [Agrobacterium tumefaciens]